MDFDFNDESDRFDVFSILQLGAEAVRHHLPLVAGRGDHWESDVDDLRSACRELLIGWMAESIETVQMCVTDIRCILDDLLSGDD